MKRTSSTRKDRTHDRIVDVASRAIRRAGTKGVGVADIMKEAGLTHGGFYAHFQSRDALVLEAMQRAWRDSSSVLQEAMLRRMNEGEDAFAALVHSYLHEVNLERVEHGCLVAALASEMPRMDAEVSNEAQRNIHALIQLVRSTLPGNVDPNHAEGLTAALVGALQLARALGGQQGRNLLTQSGEQLIQCIEASKRN